MLPAAGRSTLMGPGRHPRRSILDAVDLLAFKPPSRPPPRRQSPWGQHSSFSSVAWQPQAGRLRPSATSSRLFAKFFKPNSTPRRSFTSAGVFLVGIAPGSPRTSPVIATCSDLAQSVFAGPHSSRPSVSQRARKAWSKKGIHTTRGPSPRVPRRAKSTRSASNEKNPAAGQQKTSAQHPPPKTEKNPVPETHSMYEYFHLPAFPKNLHRPTKEEFLAAATGFWQRLKVRFKWFSIRSMRPWNIDEWGAFISWFLFGHLVWILVGTTTFVSLLILSINTVFAQETLAKWVGDYLTESAGLTVIFESAIVPRWKDGVISFRNVFVSRRPGQITSSVSKGSSSAAAAVAAAGRDTEKAEQPQEVDDGNYTQFDLTLDTVNVTLSFAKWWNGKGPLKDVEIKGVRGVVDRTSVQWSDTPVDPYSYRRVHHPGDFEIDIFKLEDLLVTIHQPKGFRPFSVSIYSCELPRLRKQYLFYDFLSANHMSGSYDGSLFTIHPRQVHGVLAGHERRGSDPLEEPGVWKKFSRLRIDGLRIDHLNRGVEGPFGWIYEGNVDIVADIRFPTEDDDSLSRVVSEFYDRLEEAVTSNRYIHILEGAARRDYNYGGNSSNETTLDISESMPEHLVPDEADIANTVPAMPVHEEKAEPSSKKQGDETDHPRYLVMDMRFNLNDVKASVPVFSSNLSYINQALVRPIVAYINAKRTYIPIGCRIVKRASDFDGSWTIYDCGLMDDASAEVYTAFARDVEDQQSRIRRFKKVGFWTLSLAVHALFMGMAGNVV